MPTCRAHRNIGLSCWYPGSSPSHAFTVTITIKLGIPYKLCPKKCQVLNTGAEGGWTPLSEDMQRIWTEFNRQVYTQRKATKRKGQSKILTFNDAFGGRHLGCWCIAGATAVVDSGSHIVRTRGPLGRKSSTSSRCGSFLVCLFPRWPLRQLTVEVGKQICRGSPQNARPLRIDRSKAY